MAGPANCAAALPVTTKIPPPTITPTPTSTKSSGPKTRFSVVAEVS